MKSTRNPWDKVEAVPRSDIKIGRKGEVRSRLWRYALYGALLLGLVAAYFVVDTVVFGSDETQGSQVTGNVESSPGSGEARLAVETWIEDQAGGGGLEEARLVAWSSSQTLPALSSDTVAAYSHAFSVDTSTLGMIDVRQVVFEDRASGAITAASTPPSIITAGEGDTVEKPEQTWQGFTAVENEQGVDAAINSWVRSYTSGDSENVRVTVRDPDTSHVYPTLSGVEAVEVNVADVAQQEVASDAPAREHEAAESWAIARVEITAWFSEDGAASGEDDAATSAPTPAATAPPSGDGGGEPAIVETEEERAAAGQGLSFTVDVRLTDMNGGTPTVTAWGPAGTGPSLTDFENAYVASN